ncbi:DUF3526 domain-containing protein [Alteromonas gilva]|uniref:DUF3526 domain-containing protein n=1 Tax=Alteromonas gilva TaxID=2987522 RepID=A0ABT5L4J8_9ALTE|nr:DUF3526 domain-containing protein [Alteromonas gilva]MDC8831959.1 DUF3526 domain-containing protein [Alteromonas gilva]
MNWLDIRRESRFVLGRKSTQFVLLASLLIALFSVWTGSAEVAQQHATIERLLAADKTDREEVTASHHDYGYVAYYSFHLTYSSPSPLAFAALGVRDVYPWKHRIRMLALEGQIHESDTQNPELAMTGRIDFAFVVAVLAPLLLILLLHDMRAAERASGRLDFLTVTARSGMSLWPLRTLILMLALWLSLLLPFAIAALLNGVSAAMILAVALVVLVYLAGWSALCYGVSRMTYPAPVLASFLLGFWLLTTFIIPAVGNVMIEKTVHGPQGGEILMTQREAVNDAWDLPVHTTMDAFVATHPQWAGKTEISSLFEWKWYYAFQQVGDQQAAPLALAYQQSAEQKYRIAGWIAWLSPATLLQRTLTHWAETDAVAAWQYEQQVRRFHSELRHFYYPLLFNNQQFKMQILDTRPEFTPEQPSMK